MAKIVPKDVLGKLSIYELALLLLSAYLHDIGMTPEQAQVQRHWRHLVFGPVPAEEGGLSVSVRRTPSSAARTDFRELRQEVIRVAGKVDQAQSVWELRVATSTAIEAWRRSSPNAAGVFGRTPARRRLVRSLEDGAGEGGMISGLRPTPRLRRRSRVATERAEAAVKPGSLGLERGSLAGDPDVAGMARVSKSFFLGAEPVRLGPRFEAEFCPAVAWVRRSGRADASSYRAVFVASMPVDLRRALSTAWQPVPSSCCGKIRVVRPPVRLPQPPGGSREDPVLGPYGLLPLVQAVGEGDLPSALRSRRCGDQRHRGSVLLLEVYRPGWYAAAGCDSSEESRLKGFHLFTSMIYTPGSKDGTGAPSFPPSPQTRCASWSSSFCRRSRKGASDRPVVLAAGAFEASDFRSQLGKAGSRSVGSRSGSLVGRPPRGSPWRLGWRGCRAAPSLRRRPRPARHGLTVVAACPNICLGIERSLDPRLETVCRRMLRRPQAHRRRRR